MDARNLQITGVATAEIGSGYVLAMHVAYDADPDPAVVEAAAIDAGDYDVPGPYRRHARVWLEGDFAERWRRSAEQREKRRRKRRIAEQGEDVDEEDSEEDFFWNRKLPDTGMLVHPDYTLHAHSGAGKLYN